MERMDTHHELVRNQRVEFEVFRMPYGTFWSAWTSDLPGCFAVALKREEALGLLKTAIDDRLASN